jgi:hypothetical protein
MQSAPDTTLLREALGALPEDVQADAQNIFAHFIAASARGGTLKPDDIAAFVQEGMAELLAFQEAHLEGKSPGTAVGVGLKGMALIGALVTAMGAEFMTGVFAFGPIIGHSIEALPLAGGGSLLLGGRSAAAGKAGLGAPSGIQRRRHLGAGGVVAVGQKPATRRTGAELLPDAGGHGQGA